MSQETSGPLAGSHMGLEPARFFPRVAAGIAQMLPQQARAWVICAWMLGVELRSVVEDIEGGAEQPELRRMAKYRFAELLVTTDTQVSGGLVPLDEAHALATAFEYGLGDLARLSGAELLQVLGFRERLDQTPDTDGLLRFWSDLERHFPGVLPNPLVEEGRAPMLKALQHWTEICRAIGCSVDFLDALLKDA
jgi:hypothetical protein